MTSTTFPRRLMEILETEDSTIINWDENGRSFQVLDSERFSKDVLPKYFRHRKLTSFQRQLNLYGFQRVHVGPLGGAYYHPLFRKDAPANCDNIKRVILRLIATSYNFQCYITVTVNPLRESYTKCCGLSLVYSPRSHHPQRERGRALGALLSVYLPFVCCFLADKSKTRGIHVSS